MSNLLKLDIEERETLESIVASVKDVRQFRRGQALLWLDAGRSAQNVSQLLNVSRQTIYNWVHRFHASKRISLTQRIADAQRCGRPPTAHGIIDPLIDQVIDKDPSILGYHSSIWTSELLVRYLSDTYGIHVSLRSVGYALKRLGIRWKFPRYELSRRSPTWRQAKGGSNADWLDAHVPSS